MQKTRFWSAAILCAALPLAGYAEDHSFKRVKVGDSKPGKRITVQIDPEEQARYLAALPKIDPNPKPREEAKEADNAPDASKEPGPAPASSYDWYWDTVPAGIDAKADRFDLALATLSQGPGGSMVGAPRLQHLQEVSEQYGKDILRATLDTNVSPALVLAVIGIESAGKSDAVS
ncbi:MAG: lytic transglycosylase domain-containing protein, partial [Tabrizicola sp.]